MLLTALSAGLVITFSAQPIVNVGSIDMIVRFNNNVQKHQAKRSNIQPNYMMVKKNVNDLEKYCYWSGKDNIPFVDKNGKIQLMKYVSNNIKTPFVRVLPSFVEPANDYWHYDIPPAGQPPYSVNNPRTQVFTEPEDSSGKFHDKIFTYQLSNCDAFIFYATQHKEIPGNIPWSQMIDKLKQFKTENVDLSTALSQLESDDPYWYNEIITNGVLKDTSDVLYYIIKAATDFAKDNVPIVGPFIDMVENLVKMSQKISLEKLIASVTADANWCWDRLSAFLFNQSRISSPDKVHSSPILNLETYTNNFTEPFGVQLVSKFGDWYSSYWSPQAAGHSSKYFVRTDINSLTSGTNLRESVVWDILKWAGSDWEGRTWIDGTYAWKIA